jgi:hypothetical protein
MGEGGADAAAVQVHGAAVLAAGEDDALIEGVVALGVDEAGVPQQIERTTLGEEVPPQAPTGGITDLQFSDQSEVAHSALFQIPPCLRVAIELLLVESRSLPQHSGGVCHNALLFKVGEAMAEGKVLG